MAGVRRNQAVVLRAGQSVGKRILRIVQREAAGRMLEWGDLLLTQGGPHRHREVAQILQHRTTAQRVGISPSRARELDGGRMKPSGSLQCWCGARASNAGPCPTPPSRSNPSLYSLTKWYKIPVRSGHRRSSLREKCKGVIPQVGLPR
jgi:hypothetical protein